MITFACPLTFGTSRFDVYYYRSCRMEQSRVSGVIYVKNKQQLLVNKRIVQNQSNEDNKQSVILYPNLNSIQDI